MTNLGRFALVVLVFASGCATRPTQKVRFQNAHELNWTAPELDAQAVSTAIPQTQQNARRLIAPAPDTTWVSLDDWSQLNGFGQPKRVALHPLRCLLETPAGLLSLEAGNHVMRWNGTDVQLGFIPFAKGSVLFIHALDVCKNIIPLLELSTPGPKTGRVIVLDPGHGGKNTGARNVANGMFEKYFTLDLALRLKPLLEARGWTVHLTRTNDVEVSLADRVTFAEEKRADLFLSLHFNSAYPSERESGLETYCTTPAGMPSNLTREFEDNPNDVYPNNAFDTQNLQYAIRIHRALVQLGTSRDRGVRRARFLGVLRGQNRPAVLIEAGYLSNPTEARRIADPAFRQLMAEAIASALE